MSKFKTVDAKHYVVMGISNGTLIPFYATKIGKVRARQGKLDEKVVTYTDGGIVEKENYVELDPETRKLDFILTKVNTDGTPLVDEFGNKNEWIMNYSRFVSEYVNDPNLDGTYVSIDGPQLFVQVLEDVRIVQHNETMVVEAGGYLNITDLTNIYAISDRDFNDTYKIDKEQLKKAM